jgi:ABC-type glutathione transport system ATPase component
MSLLNIKNLDLGFKSLTKQVDVLHGINFDIAAGEKVALVGESGSGKSVIARIVL